MISIWKRAFALRAFVVCLLLFSAACRGGGRTCSAIGAANLVPGGANQPWWESKDDPVAAQLQRVEGAMRKAGLRRAPWWARGFVSAPGTEVVRIEVRPGVCTTLVALAAQGVRDLDTTLYDASGAVLAEDTEANAHPTVQICEKEKGRRRYLHLRAYQGAGVFWIAGFEGDRASLHAAARILGGKPGVAPTLPDEVERNARVRDFVHAVRQRGFHLVRDIDGVPLDEKEALRVPLLVDASTCYSLAAFGGGSLKDVNVRILDEEDREVVRDSSRAQDGLLQFCRPTPAQLTLELSAEQGQGDTRILVFRAPSTVIGGSSNLWLGSVATKAKSLEASPRLPAEKGERSIVRAQLAYSEVVQHPLRSPARGCLRLRPTLDGGLSEVALRVIDASGKALAAGQGGGDFALHLCTTKAQNLQVQVQAKAGAGRFALSLHKAAWPEGASWSADPETSARFLDEAARASARGWSLQGKPHLHREGKDVVLPFEDSVRERGLCQALHVVALPGTALPRLWIDPPTLAARFPSPGHLEVRLCPEELHQNKRAGLRLHSSSGRARFFTFAVQRAPEPRPPGS